MESKILEELSSGEKSTRQLQVAVRANGIGMYNQLRSMESRGLIVRGSVAPDGSYFYSKAV